MNARHPSDEMLDLTTAYIVSRCIQTLAQFGVADRIGAAPRQVDDLARECEVDGHALRRVLRLLASRGVFREEGADLFGHTPLSETLRADHPNSMRAWAQMTGGPIFEAFAGLRHSLQTGQPAFQAIHGATTYQYLKSHPAERADFAEAMGDWNRRLALSVLATRDFSNTELIVDVGGSYGFLLGEILQRYPETQGIVFDLPEIADAAQRRLQDIGLASRCQAIGGDFFESVPDNGDIHLMSWILHNWNDEDCVRLLRRSRAAIRPSGRLLTIEHVLQGGNTYDFGRVSDLAMLVTFGGRERTESEYRELLDAAGFRLLQITRLSVPVFLLESEPR